jgi:hypothetical protein
LDGGEPDGEGAAVLFDEDGLVERLSDAIEVVREQLVTAQPAG